MPIVYWFRRSTRTLVLMVAIAAPAAAQRTCVDVAAERSPAHWDAPFDTRVSLRVRDVALREALDRVSAQASVHIAYSADVVPVDKRVCLTADGEPLGQVLASLLRETNVAAQIVAGRVVLAPMTLQVDNAAPSRSVSVLERVLVTGNAVATPRRPLAISVEVIDGERLRRQSLGTMSELLDAAVPGFWSWSQSPSSVVSQYGGIRGASSFATSYPKVYIDGVEVANPLLVTELNPDVVDRVEVIRGPQGSALYGSDAISGVINVITRHDGSPVAAPSIQLRSSGGAAASAYASRLVPTHEERVNVRAGTNLRSGGFALVFGQTGALVPSSESRQISTSADARIVSAAGIFTAAARFYDKRAGAGANPLLSDLRATAPSSVGTSRAVNDVPQSVRQYTVSTTAAFAVGGAWTHSFLAGIDGYSLDHVPDITGPLPSTLDTALRAARGNGDRVTVRENSVVRFGQESFVPTTLTLGMESSVLRQLGSYALGVAPVGSQRYPTMIDGVRETWNHNTGVLSQVSTSWRDAVFLSGGVRVEQNDSFSGDNRFPVLPMLGIAAVRAMGGAELKVRGAYGKGIRPPNTPARAAASAYSGNLGSYGGMVPAPGLDPEVQSGVEGGVELYIGRSFNIQLTRFDQQATGLIQNVAVSIDTFMRGGGPERHVRYQLQNVGAISNAGWELQAAAAQGPLSLSVLFTDVDSRVRTLAFGYMGDLRPGDRMLAVPAQTMSLTASYAALGWNAALTASRATDWVNYDRLSIARAFAASDGPASKDVTGARLRSFWRAYDGETHLRVTASRDISRGVALLVVGENLLGGQLGEPDNVTIRQGRTITGGLRASF